MARGQLELQAGAARLADDPRDGGGGGLPPGGVELDAGDRYAFLFTIIPEEPVSGGALMHISSKEATPASGSAPMQVALGR